MKAEMKTEISQIPLTKGGEDEAKEIHPKVRCSLSGILLIHPCVYQFKEITTEIVF